MQLEVAKRFWNSGMMEWDGRKVVACVPLIYKEGQFKDGKDAVVVRWNSAEGDQREFRLSITPKRLDEICHLAPDLFRPVFIGQISELPSGSALRKKIEKHFPREAESWAMLAVAPFPSGRKDGRHAVPAHFVTKVSPSKGIVPVRHIDMKSWHEAEAAINPRILKMFYRKNIPAQNTCIAGI